MQAIAIFGTYLALMYIQLRVSCQTYYRERLANGDENDAKDWQTDSNRQPSH